MSWNSSLILADVEIVIDKKISTWYSTGRGQKYTISIQRSHLGRAVQVDKNIPTWWNEKPANYNNF